MIAYLFKWFIAVCICLILQTAFVPAIAVAGITPDLVYIVLFVFALEAGMLGGTFAGFVIGLGLDLYSPVLGQHALAKSITGFLIGIFNERFMRTDLLIKMVILGGSMLVNDSIFTAVTIVKTGQPITVLFAELAMRSLPRALYTILFAALYYMRENFMHLFFKR
jgi:rod shape-determining protein MreD